MRETDDEFTELESRLEIMAGLLNEHLPQEFSQLDNLPQIGKFKIQKRFPGQSDSKVFLAFDEELKRQVVIKFYKQDSDGSGTTKRINEEAQALSQIDSPFVANCYGIEIVDDHVLLVMEFVGERNLRDALETRLFTVFESLKIIKQLNQGLAEIHGKNLLHRDLKPENIVLNDLGIPKIIDFGLAKTSETQTASETVGTASYIPPERIHNRTNEIGIHTDVFGLGAILYSLLTGQAPYAAETKSETYQKALKGQVTPPRKVNRHVPNDVSQFCMKLLQPDVGDRTRDTTEVERGLRLLSKRRVLKKVVMAACLLALAASIGFLIYRVLPQPHSKGTRQSADIPSSKLMRDHQNDFEISVSFSLFDGDSETVQRVQLSPDEPVQVSVGGTMKLEITTSEDCYIAVIGFEPKHPTDPSQGFESYPLFPDPDRNAIKLKRGQISDFEVSDLVASKGVDYLVVFASTNPWKFSRVDQLLDDSENHPNRIFVWRGIRTVNEKRAVWRFPYQLQ